MTDYISRADAIEAWDKLSKRGRTEFDQVLMTLPSAELPKGDLISRADAIEVVLSVPMPLRLADEIDEVLRSLPSADAVEVDRTSEWVAIRREEYEDLIADAVQQSDQYKKGFEDAKRAFLIEYARESENMRKRNAELEVMLNVQKAISADADLVRCKDCCHRVHDEERGLYYCEMYYGQGDVSDENFCQWGKRSEP